MDRITQCKGLLTKAYNTGNYKAFQDFIPLIYKYKITGMEMVCGVKAHIDKLLSSEPKGTVKQKREHEKWYVYFYFLNGAKTPIYIGKTYDIQNRLKQHLKEDEKYNQIKSIFCMSFSSETDALDYERYYTEHFQPNWNISNKGNPPSYKLPKQTVLAWAPPCTFEESHKVFKQYNIDKEKALEFQKLIDKISL